MCRVGGEPGGTFPPPSHRQGQVWARAQQLLSAPQSPLRAPGPMLHKPLFLTIPSSESFSAVGFLWLEPCIQGSSQTTEAAGTSPILILDPWTLRIAMAVLGVCGASVSLERK